MSDLDEYARRYADEYERDSFERHLVGVRRRHVLSWLEHYRARRVVEVGCGVEPLFAHYPQVESWHVVEPVPRFAELARELAGNDSRISVTQGRLEDQAAALVPERADFVVASSLLHEVADPVAFLATIRALCSDDTIVHVNVPNARSFHRLLAVEMGLVDEPSALSERDRLYGNRRRYDATAFADVLERAGFTVLESGTYFVKPFSHDQMDALFATGAFPPELIRGLDGMARYMPELGVELYANARRA